MFFLVNKLIKFLKKEEDKDSLPFIWPRRSDQSVLNAHQVLRAGSGQNDPAHGSGLLSSAAPVGLESYGGGGRRGRGRGSGVNVHARL